MKLAITALLDYDFDEPTDVLLQCEAAATPQQGIDAARIDLGGAQHWARSAAQGGIGERIWTRVAGRLTLGYQATVTVARSPVDLAGLDAVPLHRLPADTVDYLMGSRYCPSDQFHGFVNGEFGGTAGGARVIAIRDWIAQRFRYVPGASTTDTTAVDSFVRREGVCRDYAHVLITLARASGIPARFASTYAHGIWPQDFHAVAQVFVGHAWHLVDATAMAQPESMAMIGVGRDAADVAFLTAFGTARFRAQTVDVAPA